MENGVFLGSRLEVVFARIYMFQIHKVYKGDRIYNTNHTMHGSHSKTAWLRILSYYMTIDCVFIGQLRDSVRDPKDPKSANTCAHSVTTDV